MTTGHRSSVPPPTSLPPSGVAPQPRSTSSKGGARSARSEGSWGPEARPTRVPRQLTAGRRPTIADVAEAAQVSKATVSRVLNHRPDVDPGTVAVVLDVTERLGYVPSSHAVGLARGRAQSLGLLVPSFTAPWMLEVLRGVTEAIEGTAYSLTLYTTGGGEQNSLDALQARIRSQSLTGLLVMQPPQEASDLQRLIGIGVPIVAIDARGPHPGLASVASDDEAGIRSAVEHLLALGRRRLAVIAGPTTIPCYRDRLRHFREALRSADVREVRRGQLVALDDSFPAGAAAATELLSRSWRPDAVVVGNDVMALAALQVFQQRGVRVPDDVAVVGFDDISVARYADPPLSTVYNPLHEMGATAVSLLLQDTHGEDLPDSPVLVPTRLVVRRSSDPAATAPEEDLAHWHA